MKEELEALKKRSRWISVLCFLSILFSICYVVYNATREPVKSENEILLEYKVTELSKENQAQSEKWTKVQDSLEIYYAGIDKANQRTNYSINKILKQNEKNKANLLVVTDSVRLYIIDSLLRSAGVRY